MALAGRSGRGGGWRWLIVGLVLTLVVILVDASVHARSQAPVRQLSAQAWVDRVLPLLRASDTVALQLRQVRDGSAHVDAAQLGGELTSMARSARNEYRSAARLAIPAGLSRPAVLLQTCLQIRSQETAVITGAVRAQLRTRAGAPTRGAAVTVNAAARQLEAADATCRLFATRLPRADGGPLRARSWIRDPSLYRPRRLEVWLTALHNRVSLSPVHAVRIVAVSTLPGPLDTGRVERLPPSKLRVAVVVGNDGNQTERGLVARAGLSAASGPLAATAPVPRLAPGTDTTVEVGPLQPKLGVPCRLTVFVLPPRGSRVRPAGRALAFEMPAPNGPTSTTVPIRTTHSSPTTTRGT